MKELVFATHNPNKLEEIRQMVPAGIRLRSLDEIGCIEAIPETAPTLEGNARLKAEYVRSRLSEAEATCKFMKGMSPLSSEKAAKAKAFCSNTLSV